MIVYTTTYATRVEPIFPVSFYYAAVTACVTFYSRVCVPYFRARRKAGAMMVKKAGVAKANGMTKKTNGATRRAPLGMMTRKKAGVVKDAGRTRRVARKVAIAKMMMKAGVARRKVARRAARRAIGMTKMMMNGTTRRRAARRAAGMMMKMTNGIARRAAPLGTRMMMMMNGVAKRRVVTMPLLLLPQLLKMTI